MVVLCWQMNVVTVFKLRRCWKDVKNENFRKELGKHPINALIHLFQPRLGNQLKTEQRTMLMHWLGCVNKVLMLIVMKAMEMPLLLCHLMVCLQGAQRREHLIWIRPSIGSTTKGRRAICGMTKTVAASGRWDRGCENRSVSVHRRLVTWRLYAHVQNASVIACSQKTSKENRRMRQNGENWTLIFEIQIFGKAGVFQIYIFFVKLFWIIFICGCRVRTLLCNAIFPYPAYD